MSGLAYAEDSSPKASLTLPTFRKHSQDQELSKIGGKYLRRGDLVSRYPSLADCSYKGMIKISCSLFFNYKVS